MIFLKNYFKSLSKVRKSLLILLAALIFLLGALVFYYVMTYKKEEIKKIDNKKENIVVKDNYKYDNGSLIFLSDLDQEIGIYECIDKNVDQCYVAYELADDVFDETTSKYEDKSLVEVRSKIYFNRFVFIYDNEEVFLYDFISKEKIGKYQVKSFYNKYITAVENNYVILKNENDKYGVVDLDSDKMITIIPFNYDYLGVVKKNLAEKNNKLVYKNKNNWGIVSFKNKILYTTKEQITDYNDSYIKTINEDNTYNLYKYDKTKVLENYSYIDTLSDFVVTITDNKYLMVSNLELVPLYSNLLTIQNYDYVEVDFYNLDKEYLYSSKAYEVSAINNVLYVNILNGETKNEYTFDILEGVISANYDYYSYSNGTIYFYSDLEKTIGIGSYKCSNKNNLVDSSNVFPNCYLAPDLTDSAKNYTIPIYNNRFIFVYDAPTLVNETTIKYYLYDLKTNKKLGKYLRVYAEAKESKNKNGVYLESETPKYAIAVNDSNKYGLLQIDKEEVTKAVSFLYDDIKMQDKYLLGKVSNKWALLDYKGATILDNTYQVYKLYPEYIIAIDSDNKLFVFDYNKKQIINNPIVLDAITDDISLYLEKGNLVVAVNSKNYKYDLTTGEEIGGS